MTSGPASKCPGGQYIKCLPCSFYKWLGAPLRSPLPTPAVLGSVEHLVDARTLQLLQAVFAVPVGTSLGEGRDQVARSPPKRGLQGDG